VLILLADYCHRGRTTVGQIPLENYGQKGMWKNHRQIIFKKALSNKVVVVGQLPLYVVSKSYHQRIKEEERQKNIAKKHVASRRLKENNYDKNYTVG
jgi:glycerol dehydrogenase-like iron-containing ADH family enzyme